jgi:hypothetical protein
MIHVLRKTLTEGTVAANTLRHGTGGLNIDASRILRGPQPKPTTAPGWDAYNKVNAEQGYRPKEYQQGYAAYVPSAQGRWPANVILQHLDGCRCEGIKRVKGAAPQGRKGDWRGHGGSIGNTGLQAHAVAVGRTDEDGKETVANWICEPECPVARLDEQSGERKTTWIDPSHKNNRDGDFMGALNHPGHQGYNDTGGASRFYKQMGGGKDA